jgi:hypothetical protein
MENPVEPGAQEEYDVAFCSAEVRAAATDSGWSSGITPLPIGDRRNGICVRLIKVRTSSTACDHAMPLSTSTSRARFIGYSGKNGVRDCPGTRGSGRSAQPEGEYPSRRAEGA